MEAPPSIRFADHLHQRQGRVHGLPARYRGDLVVPRNVRGRFETPPPRAFGPDEMEGRRVRQRLDTGGVAYTRRRRRRFRRGFRREYIPRSLAPQSIVIRAHAVHSGTTNASSTSPDTFPCKTLDITDPFGAQTNKQPLGYDQWAALYGRAKVLWTKITFTVHNAGSVALMFGITPIPESGVTTTTPWEYQAEAPGAKYRILSPEMDHSTITYQCRTKERFRIKDIRDTEEIACNLLTETQPDRDAWINPWVALHNGTTSTAYDYVIKMEFVVLLDKLIQPSRSTDSV